MIIVILSGGLSSRMGQDKGLMQEQGQAWVEKLYDQLAYLNLPVYTSVNAKQQATYQSIVPAQQLVIDDALEGINGPLKGILSAHHAYPDQHIMFVPCDMPLLDAPVFDGWLKSFEQHYPEYELFISKTSNRLQPLCGIYTREGLQHLNELYRQNKLKNLSMHVITEDLLHTYMMHMPDQLLPQFKNFNTPEDLR